MFAPLALFVYNRPVHVQLTVEALQKNSLAEASDLFVFSDGPKSVDSAERVREVREYIKTIRGFKTVSIVERDCNFGLARSIVDGVTRLCNEYERVIVLEDDLITSPCFITYMNEALETYRDEAKVMHISGYMFPINSAELPETFFLRTASCWGWATWKRAWQHFNKEPKKLIGEYSVQKIKRFNMDGTYDFWDQVKRNESGLINSWAIFWYATIFDRDGLCLHPTISMTNNIGHDNTGENCKEGDAFITGLADSPITYFEKNISESALAHARTKEYFRKIHPGFLRRMAAKIKIRFIF